MSTQARQKVLSCHNCGVDTPEGQHVELGDGWYCNLTCAYEHKGERALTQLENDHTICGSCYRRVKEVSKPPDGVNLNIGAPDIGGQEFIARDCLVGYQYPTEHTEWGIDDNGKDADERVFFTRWMCSCGVVDPNTKDEFPEEFELEATIDRLCERLEELNEKGAIGGSFSAETFRDAFDTEERNFAYATGVSLYD